MLFNSIDFAVFLPIVFGLYWYMFNKNLRLQNSFILFASYIFYGWWDWRFLSLIAFSSLVDFVVGLQLQRTKKKLNRKLWLSCSLATNLGMLGFIKYFNFFTESFASAFTLIGNPIDPLTLKIVLPVGISFYTFQTLSYTIDVYREKLKPTRDPIAFFAFVSFFPQLVAGPIERASNLLPQFFKERRFKYHEAADGCYQILWGLFKKMVIADNCAVFANEVFNNYQDANGSALFLGAFFFTIQIYCDFSGYSDIALGVSRLFGFRLMKNFAFPYFSRDIAEFWRRWHISLSTWFRDYIYIPLGGSKGSKWMQLRNVFIIFVVSGFWHGANWTFIVWGAVNALLFIPLMLFNVNRKNLGDVSKGRLFAKLDDFAKMAVTFFLTILIWVFFRSENLGQAFHILDGVFSFSFFEFPNLFSHEMSMLGVLMNFQFYLILFLILGFMIVEWLGRQNDYAIEKLYKQYKIVKYPFIFFIVFLVLTKSGGKQEFIYFQF